MINPLERLGLVSSI